MPLILFKILSLFTIYPFDRYKCVFISKWGFFVGLPVGSRTKSALQHDIGVINSNTVSWLIYLLLHTLSVLLWTPKKRSRPQCCRCWWWALKKFWNEFKSVFNAHKTPMAQIPLICCIQKKSMLDKCANINRSEFGHLEYTKNIMKAEQSRT